MLASVLDNDTSKRNSKQTRTVLQRVTTMLELSESGSVYVVNPFWTE